MSCTAIITGITGQDGSYLAELLLEKGYTVHGLVRRTSTNNTQRLESILTHSNLRLHEADLSDTNSIRTLIESVARDSERLEIYNLGAQSHVHTSFRQPEYTADVDALGPLRILETIRCLNIVSKTRFYQASTSELFGKVKEVPQTETTPFHPRSPYAVAKLYAYWIVKNYRESYGMYACNGILFNHESERRGDEFITQKVTKGLKRVYTDPSFTLEIGNLDAQRDWGYAPEYVEGMWKMLQQDVPDDYILATGKTHSVREFVEIAMNVLGHTIKWEGIGLDEVGKDETGRIIVRINKEFYRPAEVDLLIGNSEKARKVLGWEPSVTFKELVTKMIKHDPR